MSPLQQSFLEQDPHARRALDFYRTPAWMTLALLQRLRIPSYAYLLEPTSGDLAIVRVLATAGFTNITTNDLNREYVAQTSFDATLAESWRVWGTPDAVIGNPPFGVSFDIVRLAVTASPFVAMLQRENFDEPTIERGPWFKANRPTLKIVMPRWNFRSRDGKGEQHFVPTCWFVWDRVGFALEQGNDYVTREERDALMGRAA